MPQFQQLGQNITKLSKKGTPISVTFCSVLKFYFFSSIFLDFIAVSMLLPGQCTTPRPYGKLERGTVEGSVSQKCSKLSHEIKKKSV